MSETPTSPAGKTKGTAKNYTERELVVLTDILHDVVPVAGTEWKGVEMRFNATRGTNPRDVASLKRKYYKIVTSTGPSGGPFCKGYVRKAKQVSNMITEKSEMGAGWDLVRRRYLR